MREMTNGRKVMIWKQPDIMTVVQGMGVITSLNEGDPLSSGASEQPCGKAASSLALRPKLKKINCS